MYISPTSLPILPLCLFPFARQISNSDKRETQPKLRHCGTSPKQILTSAGPKFYVHFNTDAEHNGRGFTATYRVIKSSEYHLEGA